MSFCTENSRSPTAALEGSAVLYFYQNKEIFQGIILKVKP